MCAAPDIADPCDHCHSTGACPACDGEGGFDAIVDSDEEGLCDECDGTGVCPACGG